MKTAIIGKKVGMTQIFDEAGKVVPVTVIEAGPCTVTGKMTKEKEGYEAVQLGYEDVAEKKLTKPEKGHLDKAGVGYKKHLKEFRLEDCASVNVGDVVKADTFKEGDKVDITGISKGHGYAGVIKRFGQGRTPTSHGGGPVHRHAGSMGSSTDPSRIFPGKKQAGHMGVDQVTVQNLDVVKVDPELNMIVVRGAIPGPKGALSISRAPSRRPSSRRATPASAPTRRRPPVVTRRRLLQESKERRERICLLLSCLIWPAIRSAKWRSPKPFSVLSPTSPSCTTP